MELFMANVDWAFTRFQLTETLADILHGPFFAHLSEFPINFHIHLHPDKARIRHHSGTGALTLPTHEIGTRFLALFGSESIRPIKFGKKVIQFSPSRRNPKGRPDVVQQITLLRYVDPWVQAEHDRRIAHLGASGVPLRFVQFGWECRDYVLSVECEHECRPTTKLHFSAERREIRINLDSPDRTVYHIAIPYSHINSMVAHYYLQKDAAIIFLLNTPPTYEQEIPGAKLRSRLSYLPIHGHDRVAPYTSLAFRVVCSSPEDLQEFRRLCQTAQLNKLDDYEYPIARRSIFSSDALTQLQQHLRRLNWIVAFQVESIVRGMVVDVKEMLELIPYVFKMVNDQGKLFASTVLQKFGAKAKAMYSDGDYIGESVLHKCLLETQKEVSKLKDLAVLMPSDGSLCYSYHVQITPTSIFLDGPFPERSNRVLRSYDPQHHESFLRVSFVDEGKLRYRFDREIDGPQFIRRRVGPFLKNPGLEIAGRTFQFLAYSQSALKEHAVWFVKAFRDAKAGFVDAKTIIHGLGNFSNLASDKNLIFCPARYAARLSQAFTATDAVRVEVEEIIISDDIRTPDGQYTFTDGVGTLSMELALEIWSQLKATKRRGKRNRVPHPRSYQIRLMGSKGMLSVDHKLRGLVIILRPSMIKFEAPNTNIIEIARAFDRPAPYYLNRPLIMLLEGLGVEYDVFKKYQDQAVRATKNAARSFSEAASLLEGHGLGTSFRVPSVMLSLEKLHINSLPNDEFYAKMLQYAINHVLRLLKTKARIPIPNAWTLVGIADVHRHLQPNQIFACIKPLTGKIIYLSGPVLISRSPTIHPGDVAIVHAIGSPPPGSPFAVNPLPNNVVFSVLGDRPVPSGLGGGDLDGDVYNLIPLEDLPEFAPKTIQKPASYDPAPKKLLGRPSTMDDVADFVMEYINSDVVGIIAVNWLIIADQSHQGIFDEDCIKLAQLHSDAVDYPKSGQPVSQDRIPKLKHKLKPDWNAPETVNLNAGDYYESTRAIGRLFRAIDLPVIQHRSGNHSQRRSNITGSRDKDLKDLEKLLRELDLKEQDNAVFLAVHEHVNEFIDTDSSNDEEELESVQELFSKYCLELRAICVANTLSHARGAQLSEEEAVIGTIIQKSSQPRKRADAMATLRESTDILVRGIRENLSGDDDDDGYDHLYRAWLGWKLALAHKKTFGAQSFAWVALGGIFEAIREIEEDEAKSTRGY